MATTAGVERHRAASPVGLSAVLGAATGAERAQVYASLALRLDYDPYLRRVRETADVSRVAGCVRGGV
jgi:site-specific DNA recombinase